MSDIFEQVLEREINYARSHGVSESEIIVLQLKGLLSAAQTTTGRKVLQAAIDHIQRLERGETK